MISFNKKYNKESFLDFLTGFLPEDFSQEDKDISSLPEFQKITTAKEIGICESLDLTVLEISHRGNSDPRITVATEAFKVLKNYDIQKALIVFKNEDSNNWRFSYLTIELDIDEKNKIVKTYSNARRYSFYLGNDAKTKTPEQQLVKKGRIKDNDDLLDRFSVEVVNKEFYLQIAKFFDDLVDETTKVLELPSQTDESVRKSFAVRLIGRVMFCWFLKHKKSQTSQLISDELLSSGAITSNYYHNVLEPLFFSVLNTNLDSRDVRSDLFDSVPYLNGGLFNPQAEDYFELDSTTYLSKHINSLKVSDSWFKDFFELLETYNFTIDENTIFDQELSVDPEMLGRIFENLLAEINPETETSERKRSGSFYTPRQIVEHMVDKSLFEYFSSNTKIDNEKILAVISYDPNDDLEFPLCEEDKSELIKSIASLKILDPACGSGAYPIGILQKIVYVLQQIDPDCEKWLNLKLKNIPDLYRQKIINEVKANPFNYTRKLDVIKNSIFGVDIQPIAVDVARLRCFLTLVVESEINDSQLNRGIEPLPNLDFKFVCANTLIDLPSSKNEGLFEDHTGISELSKIMSDYFSCNSQRKNEIKINFTNMQKSILEKNVSAFGKNTGDLTLKLTTWNPFSNHSNSWFDPEWMFGLQEKFDIVIGNPPYGILNKKQNKGKSIVVSEDVLSYYKEDSQYTSAKGGMLNIYRLFVVRSISMLKENGVFSEIFPLAFMCDLSASNLRKYVLANTQPISIEAFPERDNPKKRVFESVKMSVCILLLRKTNTTDPFFIRINGNRYVDNTAEKNYLNKETIEILDAKNLTMPLTSIEETKILIKVFGKSKTFSELGKCNTGEIDMTLCKSSFTEDSANPALLKGAIIGRYVLRKKMSQGEIVFIDEEKLQKVKNIDTDFKLQRRVVLQGITGVNEKTRLKMMIVENAYCANSLNYLNFKNSSVDPLVVLGIFNSKLMNFIFSKFSTNSNVNGYEVDNLPFPKELFSKDSEMISNLVSSILTQKEEDADADISINDSELDNIVMNLFDLDNDEKNTILNS